MIIKYKNAIRMIAIGLEKQEKIFDRIIPKIRKNNARPETIMLAGSLERISIERKVNLGKHLLDQVLNNSSKSLDAPYWALDRLVSRLQLHATEDRLIPAAIIEEWFRKILKNGLKHPKVKYLLLSGARKIGPRSLEISETLRQETKNYLQKNFDISESFMEPLEQPTRLNQNDIERQFGEKLPSGFMIF